MCICFSFLGKWSFLDAKFLQFLNMCATYCNLFEKHIRCQKTKCLPNKCCKVNHFAQNNKFVMQGIKAALEQLKSVSHRNGVDSILSHWGASFTPLTAAGVITFVPDELLGTLRL